MSIHDGSVIKLCLQIQIPFLYCTFSGRDELMRNLSTRLSVAEAVETLSL